MADEVHNRRGWQVYLSLQFRLLFLFILLFALALLAAFFWFSDFATDLALEDLREDLEAIAVSAAEDVSSDGGGDDFVHVLEVAEAGEEDARQTEEYLDINLKLRRAKWNNPKASGMYSITANPEDPGKLRSIWGECRDLEGVEPTPRDTAIASVRLEGCQVPPSSVPPPGIVFTRADFGDVFLDGALVGLQEPAVTSEIYTDSFGTWLSAFAPIISSDGDVVAVGLDACAADIEKIEDDIRDSLLVAMLGAFVVMAGVVSLVAYSITRPIKALTNVAVEIGQGDYQVHDDLHALSSVRFADEVSKLADVFDIMVEKVAEREETLKAKVASLQIIIDEGKRDKQVAELTETEFFSDIKAKAEKLRKGKPPAKDDDDPESTGSDDDSDKGILES